LARGYVVLKILHSIRVSVFQIGFLRTRILINCLGLRYMPVKHVRWPIWLRRRRKQRSWHDESRS